MASETDPGPGDDKNLARKKRKYRERQLKINVRKYTVRNEFDGAKGFEDWIAGESKKAPWYLCSSYKAGGVLKRIYACSFRKRAGYKKCDRQLMVLFYPNGRVTVLDSCSEREHEHQPVDSSEGSRELRTVISLRSQAEFSSWMTKQRERFAWHRRAGRRSFSNIDYYQCASVGSDGAMCKRVMHVEYTPENGVIIRELEHLPPHDNAPAHRRPYVGAVKRQRRAKRANSDSEYLPSTSNTKAVSRMRRSVFDEGVKQEPDDEDDDMLDGKETPADCATTRSAHSIEDFVIIPDDDYETDGNADNSNSDGRCLQVKKELLESMNDNRKSRSDFNFINETLEPKGGADRQIDHTGNPERRSWGNVLHSPSNVAKNQPGSHCNGSVVNEDDPKYNLENFAEELANKLSKTPLERMAEIRESVRREMDEVFAQQIVKEIVSRSYSAEARREVLDRIREVLRPP